MPSVLVTGATGYIGSRLMNHFAATGRPAIGTSRSPDRPPQGWPEDMELVAYSVDADPPVSPETLQSVHAIVHLAAANESRSAADPDAAILETVAGTRRLLRAAVEAGVQRFVFMSTIHVYGALEGVLTEKSPVSPIHPYAITHLAAEHFVGAAHRRNEILGLVVRLSNGIGAPAWSSVDRWSLVGNDLSRQAVEKGCVTVKTPNQWRDFILLRDVCAGIDTLLESPPEVLGDGVYNLGGAMPLKMIEIAERVAEAAEAVLGEPVRVEKNGSVTTSDAPPFAFDIARIQALGFRPSGVRGLDAELEATVRLVAGAPASI